MQVKLLASVMLISCMAAQVALLSAPHAKAAISCGQMQGALLPCLGFLQGGALVPQCCAGVKSVAAATRTPGDRRAVCNCLKAAATSFKNINFGKAASLPGKCGVRLSFTIGPNTDCSRVR